MIAPGQTITVLLTADRTTDTTTYPLAVRPYVTAPDSVPFDNTTAIGFIHYSANITNNNNDDTPSVIPHLPINLPSSGNTSFVTDFSSKHRSLSSDPFPCKVPTEVDKQVFLAISLNLEDCCHNCTCKGFSGKRFSASINNQSFVRLHSSMLQSYYYNRSDHAPLLQDFPEWPTNPFNCTSEVQTEVNLNSKHGAKVLAVPYGARLDFVLQGTSLVNAENHPIHIHGHNFFIVGSGLGNYDKRDKRWYNLVDPPERNTVAVPSGGWVAIRLRADNPGIWFVHCHLEIHTTWGLAMGFVVKNGMEPGQSLLPPPCV